jgi:hypothetical protein
MAVLERHSDGEERRFLVLRDGRTSTGCEVFDEARESRG